MTITSLVDNITYHENKPTVTVLLKTDTTKELRIVMKQGQTMKEHQAPYPIVIEIFEGSINFGVNDVKKLLNKDDLIALDANIPHHLTCMSDCINRLSLSIYDSVERVKNVNN